jgi:hypothetical protein
MSSSARGYSDRVGQHQNKVFRDAHPTYHYVVMDTPGTSSDFRSVATNPPATTKGIFLLSEGYLIAIFSLCENSTFLRIVSCLNMPAINIVRGHGHDRLRIGINRDPGLSFLSWDDTAAREARDSKSQKKAMELITTG